MFDENFYADLEKEEYNQRGDELDEQRAEREHEQQDMEAYPAEGNVY